MNMTPSRHRSLFLVQLLALITAILLPSAVFAEGPIELTRRERDKLKKETIQAIDLIQSYHYKQRYFSEVDPAELITNYMETLDFSHLFFLKSDHEFILDRFAPTLKPTYLFVGDLYPAFEIYNTYYHNVMARLDWIEQRMTQPFDFDTNLSYQPDRSEADWPATQEEADQLWERRLTHELIMEMLEGDSEEIAREKITKRYERRRRVVNEFESHNVQEYFLTTLAQMYDPHSSFFSWDSAQEFNIQISNSLVGIGAHLRDVDGYCVIERLLPGGPAEMSESLHPGDKIVGVAQGDGEMVDVVGMKLRKVVQLIRGKVGSEVRLTVINADSNARKVISLVREKIELTANLASGHVYEIPSGNELIPIGVITLPSFYGEGEFEEDNISTSRDVEELIGKLMKIGAQGLVLDLRSNGGGRLDEAIKLTGLFIEKGPVVMKRSFNGQIEEDWDEDPSYAYDGPLVVLVSKASASASEIVAGALQSYGRAIVVGDESTHGKGTVQAPISLEDAMRRLPWGRPLEVGTVKITVQKFYLPDGASTQNKGVQPDIILPSASEFMMDGEADLDYALAWDTIRPSNFELEEASSEMISMVNPDLLSSLRQRSQARLRVLPEFQFLNRNIDWLRERYEQEEYSLNLEQRRRLREEYESMRDTFDKERDSLAKNGYEAEKVDLDLTRQKDKAHQAKLVDTPLPNGRPRANNFYQKVFYFQENPDSEIKEVWVEFLDYEKALDHTEQLAKVFTEAFDSPVEPEEVESVLTTLKNADREGDFDVSEVLEVAFLDRASKAAIENSLPAFFREMVRIDDDILRDRAKLDIALRESLRIVADWVALTDPSRQLVPLALTREEAAAANPGSKAYTAAPKADQVPN